MSAPKRLKTAVKSALRRFGYDRPPPAPPPPDPSFPVLPFVVESWLRTGRGCHVVQVGAHTGRDNDPVRGLITRHALPALLVEPVPWLFDQLVANYAGQPGVGFEQAAVGERDGTAPFYCLRGGPGVPQWCDQVGSFDRAHLDRIKPMAPKADLDRYLEVIQVPVLTLPTLLAKHKVRQVDLLQVDVEGFDDVVVRQAVVADHPPRIINFEHHHVPADRRAACYDLLFARGYRYLTLGPDTLAVRCDSEWPLTD